MKIAVYVYALASVATGLMNLVWGQFQGGYEPIQAFGNVPGLKVFVYVFAIALVAAGLALLWQRSRPAGAAALTVIYGVFAIFWLPRLVTGPQVLGYHLPVYVGVLDGVGQQLILAAGAAIVYAASQSVRRQQRAAAVARWVFGLSSIDFGLAHLDGIGAVAPLVPRWLPPGQDFWVVLTGCAFVLAGIAIVSGVLDVPAARLLSLMLLVFSALALSPMIAASPHDQGAWGSNAYNITAIAAVWMYACAAAARRAEIASASLGTAGFAHGPSPGSQ